MENKNIKIKTKNDILFGVFMGDKHDDKRYKENPTQKNSCINRENAGSIEMTYFMFEK